RQGLAAPAERIASTVTQRAARQKATRANFWSGHTRKTWWWSALPTALLLLSCNPPGSRSGPTNDLLIVGYDREPDTLNRYSTHILEDIESCVVEGLTTNDENMRIVPVLASEIPTLENGGVKLRSDGGMDVTWKLRPGIKWHDGQPHTSADLK